MEDTENELSKRLKAAEDNQAAMRQLLVNIYTTVKSIDQKADAQARVLNDLLTILGEEEGSEELPDNTLDGHPGGKAREEGKSLG
jgi:hypothetical protein